MSDPSEYFDRAMEEMGKGFAIMKQMNCTVEDYRDVVRNIHVAMTDFITNVVIPHLDSTPEEMANEMGRSD